jgi:hypothetical protein
LVISNAVLPHLPTGSVDFIDSVSGDLGTYPLVGTQAQVSTSALAKDNHTITADYGGDSHFQSSHGTTVQSVLGATTTTVMSSLNPSITGHSVTFTVAVTSPYGSPTRTVTLTDSVGDFSPQTLTIGVSLQYTTSALSINNHTITAVYNGDSNFATSQSSLNQQVVDHYVPTIAISTTVDPSMTGKDVTFTTTVQGVSINPTGTVTLHDNLGGFPDQVIPLVLVGGVPTAAYGPISTLLIGSHTISATYNGDSDFHTGQVTLVQLVLTPRGDILFDLPGFAILASYSSQGDTNLPSWASFTAVPETTTAGTPVYLLWTSNNVVTIGIVEVSGSPSYPPVILATSGSGIYEFTGGFTASAVLACTGYDINGNAVATENVLITIT